MTLYSRAGAVLALVTNHEREIMKLGVAAPEPGSDGAPLRRSQEDRDRVVGRGVTSGFSPVSPDQDPEMTTAGYRPIRICTSPDTDFGAER